MSGHDLFRFEKSQQLLSAFQYRRWEACQPSDFDPIRPIGSSRLEPVKEQHLVADFPDLNIIVAD